LPARPRTTRLLRQRPERARPMANCPPGFKLPCGVASRTVGGDWQSGFGGVGPRVNPVRVVNRRFPVLEPGCPAGRVAAVSPSGGRGCCPPGAVLIDTAAGVRCVWPVQPSMDSEDPPDGNGGGGRGGGGARRDDNGAGSDRDQPCPSGQYRPQDGAPCEDYPCPYGLVPCGAGENLTCCEPGQCAGPEGCFPPDCNTALTRWCHFSKPTFDAEGKVNGSQIQIIKGCTNENAKGPQQQGYVGIAFCKCAGIPSAEASCGGGPNLQNITKPKT
jgi:hypothetical protein